MSLKNAILVLLYVEFKKDEPDPDRVYRSFARSGRVDDLLTVIVELYKGGCVYVPYKSWSPHGETSAPEDIVMTGVKLTEYGKRKARQLEPQLRELLT